MKPKPILLSLLLVAVSLSVLLSLIPMHVSASPSVTLTPNAGIQYTYVQVTGSGFSGPDSCIFSLASNPTFNFTAILPSCAIGAPGNLTAAFIAGANSPGTYTITIIPVVHSSQFVNVQFTEYTFLTSTVFSSTSTSTTATSTFVSTTVTSTSLTSTTSTTITSTVASSTTSGIYTSTTTTSVSTVTSASTTLTSQTTTSTTSTTSFTSTSTSLSVSTSLTALSLTTVTTIFSTTISDVGQPPWSYILYVFVIGGIALVVIIALVTKFMRGGKPSTPQIEQGAVRLDEP